MKQAEEMERLVRKHPSTIMVSWVPTNAFPNARGSCSAVLSASWPNTNRLFTALDQAVLITNPDRAIAHDMIRPRRPASTSRAGYNGWYNLPRLPQSVKPGGSMGRARFREGPDREDGLNTIQRWLPVKGTKKS